jgi:hypothetical protein
LHLLPDYDAVYAEITTDIGTPEDAAAIAWYAALNGNSIRDEITALECRAEQLARAGADEAVYRQAITALAVRVRQIRQWHRDAQHEAEVDPPPQTPDAATGKPWRVVIEENRPLPGPIQLNCCTTITNPLLSIERTLVDLELAIAHKNAGRDTAFTRLVDEYVERLAACGCCVRVERVS